MGTSPGTWLIEKAVRVVNVPRTLALSSDVQKTTTNLVFSRRGAQCLDIDVETVCFIGDASFVYASVAFHEHRMFCTE